MISVIIPVYNVERYLERCVNSIINQTYKDLEIILVDDGSSDNSSQMCDDFIKKDSRVRCIHKKNGGLSSARNAGLDIASGEYIGFVDSDDFVEPTMYEKMLDLLISENCDLVECATNFLCRDGQKIFEKKENVVMPGKVALERHLDWKIRGKEYVPQVNVWSKLYKSVFWRERRFPEGKIHEDYFFNCQAFYYANRVGFLQEGLYNYLTYNENSITNAKFSVNDLYLINQYEFRMDFLKDKNEKKLYEMAKCEYYNLIIGLLWKCRLSSLKEENDIRKKILKNKFDILMSRISIKRKIDYLCYFIHPSIWLFMRSRMK